MHVWVSDAMQASKQSINQSTANQIIRSNGITYIMSRVVCCISFRRLRVSVVLVVKNKTTFPSQLLVRPTSPLY